MAEPTGGTPTGQIFDQVVVDIEQAITAYEQVIAMRAQATGQAGGVSAPVSAPGTASAAAGVTAQTTATKQAVVANQELAAAENQAGAAGMAAAQETMTAQAESNAVTNAAIRDFREQAQITRREVSQGSSITGFGRNLVDQLFGTDADRARVRTITGEYSEAMRNLTSGQAGLTVEQAKQSPQIMALQGELDGLRAKYTGMGGAVNAFKMSLVESMTTMMMVVPEMMLIQLGIQLITQVAGDMAKMIQEALDPTIQQKAAWDDVSKAIQGANNSVGQYIASLGLNSGPDSPLTHMLTVAQQQSDQADQLTKLAAMLGGGGSPGDGATGAAAGAAAKLADAQDKLVIALMALAEKSDVAGGFLGLWRTGFGPGTGDARANASADFQQNGFSPAAIAAFWDGYDKSIGSNANPSSTDIQGAEQAGAQAMIAALSANTTAQIDGAQAIVEAMSAANVKALTSQYSVDDAKTQLGYNYQDQMSALQAMAEGKDLTAAQLQNFQGINAQLAQEATANGAVVSQLTEQLKLAKAAHDDQQYNDQLKAAQDALAIAEGKRLTIAAGLTDSLKSQLALLDAQTAAQQRQLQLEQIRQALAQASVAGPGMSGFDVYANEMQAKANADKQMADLRSGDARTALQGRLDVSEAGDALAKIISDHSYQGEIADMTTALTTATQAAADGWTRISREAQGAETVAQRAVAIIADAAKVSGSTYAEEWAKAIQNSAFWALFSHPGGYTPQDLNITLPPILMDGQAVSDAVTSHQKLDLRTGRIVPE